MSAAVPQWFWKIGSGGVEVVAKATPRRFTAEYTLTVLREADACTEPGEIGVLLRREGFTPPTCASGAISGVRGSSWGSPPLGEALRRRRSTRWRQGGGAGAGDPVAESSC